MSKKKKLKKSEVARKRNKKSTSSLIEHNAQCPTETDSITLHSSLNKTRPPFLRFTNKVGNIKAILKRQSIYLAVIGILIVALTVWGVNAYFFEEKDTPPNPTIEDKSITDTYTTPSPSTDKLKIEDVVVSDITEGSLTVTWRTNKPSTSEVLAYEQTTGFSIGGWPDNNLVREHKIILDGLAPSTIYNLKIKSKDASGNQAMIDIDEPYQTLSPRLSTDMSVGELSPDFTLQTVAGERISLTDFKGKRVMIVFWKVSCKACREELPFLQDFWINLTDNDLILLTINMQEKEDYIANYVKSQKLTFPVLLDLEGEVSDKYTIAIFPTTFLISEDGTVNKIQEDKFKNEKEIDKFVRSSIKDE